MSTWRHTASLVTQSLAKVPKQAGSHQEDTVQPIPVGQLSKRPEPECLQCRHTWPLSICVPLQLIDQYTGWWTGSRVAFWPWRSKSLHALWICPSACRRRQTFGDRLQGGTALITVNVTTHTDGSRQSHQHTPAVDISVSLRRQTHIDKEITGERKLKPQSMPQICRHVVGVSAWRRWFVGWSWTVTTS